ncbi:hypothetical protein BB934_16050 [Microvirga ossetica]|uniref:Peptidase S8/S53 domain-containing protein n=1 Tax=Microvirga ossetica TaxID=1882682 RepID=A0A1B2EHU9_9HYPH|nr:S8 family serine peptidase [Microvirga ossetica]ANY79551.1 hypothetical protein BB934_16050 [Microvirga ossetica]
MTARRRPLLIAVSCLALACPVRVQIDVDQNLSIALTDSPATAKEGNNGNGNGGNGNGNGNSGNSGNSGKSGDNGNANGNGNAGGSKGNGNGNGNGESKSNPGGNGNGANNGNGGSKGNGNANGNSGQGNSSNAGQSNGQGPSSEQKGSSAGGQSSGQKASNSQGTARSSQSPLTGGLSALFGAIAASLRAPPPEPLVYKRATTHKPAKAKPAPARPSSSQASVRREIKEDRTKARNVDRSGMMVRDASSASLPRGSVANAPAGSPLPKPARAKDSIVAVGLSPLGLNRLKAQGFQAELQTRGTLVSVARLVPPRGMSLGEARRQVRVTDAGAVTDFDHFYYTDEGQACTGPGCEAVSLVGWNMSPSRQCGPVPTIGLIDTGIDRDHEALQGQSIDVLPMPQSRGAPSQRDHGTAVAALLVGRSDSNAPGLLPQANLVAVDAFYRDGGTADRTDVTTLVVALEALAERSVRIVNLSLSGPPNEVLKRAIASAQEKGMLIVAAAGNNGPGAAPSYPAAYPGVIAVTAVDHNLAIYSRATQGEYIDLAAPGVNLWVAAPGGGGTAKSGTSYAVPFISAAAAILRASDALPDVASVQTTLEGKTLDLGKPGRDRTFGFGLLQAANLCQPHQDETPVARSATETGFGVP